MPLDERYTEKDHDPLAAVLRGKSYDRKVVLICWRHGQIPALATALGAGEVPEKWPADRFDLVWRLDYGSPGAPRFHILPQLLLYGDQPAD